MQYRYANYQGKIVNISDTNKIIFQKNDLICLFCNMPMIVKRGPVREWHFAHLTVENNKCTYESYLHKLAKLTLFNNIKNRMDEHLPINLNIHQKTKCSGCYLKSEPCIFDGSNKLFDISKRYYQVKLECNYLSFRPDIMIYNETDHIFIEIIYKHNSTKEKIKSDNKIIEIEVTDESDIHLLSSDCINPPSISSLVNFSIKHLKQNVDINKCNIIEKYFIVYKSGKAVIVDVPLMHLEKYKNIIAYKEHVQTHKVNRKYEYINRLNRAYKLGNKVISCYMCKHISILKKYLKGHDFCRLLKKEIIKYCFFM